MTSRFIDPVSSRSFDSSLMLDDAAALVDRVQIRAVSSGGRTPRVVTGGMVSSPYNLASAQVFGIDAARERAASKVDDAVIAGNYLSGKRGEVLIGRELQEQLEVDLGDRLVVTLAEAESGELAQALFRVSGILEFGIREFDARALFINLSQAQDVLALDDQVHQIVVQLHDRDTAENPSSSIFKLARDELDVISWLDANPAMASILSMTGYSSTIVGMILFFLASLGVINSMFMSIFERIYEIGVIKAIGTKPWQIVLLVVSEAALIALISVCIGLAAGEALGYYFPSTVLHSGEVEISGVAMSSMKTVLLPRHFIDFPIYVVILTVLASLYPARFASRIIPAHALKRTLSGRL
ncbi:MAG: FtsX-like permease family protein [Gammaproteobacteria bacterium]|nr:FtsX-like permease family protein [Gammaproteobacteria bacterium]